MKINDKEFEAVLKLKPFDRYQYFIKRVADSELMYTVVDDSDNWAIADVEGTNVLSIWPAREYALENLFDEWKDFTVKEFTLEYFEDEIIDRIEENNYLLNVFSIKGKSGFVVDINEFARDLSDEMGKYS